MDEQVTVEKVRMGEGERIHTLAKEWRVLHYGWSPYPRRGKCWLATAPELARGWLLNFEDRLDYLKQCGYDRFTVEWVSDITGERHKVRFERR